MSDLPRAIYTDLTGIRLARPRVPPAPALRLVEPIAAPAAEISTSDSEHDAEIIRLLSTPALPGESAELFHRRKEQLLGALFATLSIAEADALHHRLASPRVGDSVAAQFGRLAFERRERLLAFLADARRRETIALARRPRLAAGAR